MTSWSKRNEGNKKENGPEYPEEIVQDKKVMNFVIIAAFFSWLVAVYFINVG